MSKGLKTSYDVLHQVESFFTGSQIIFDTEGEHFYCAYGSSLNKVCIQDGQIKAQVTTKNEGDTIIKFVLTSDDDLLIIAYFSGLITKFNLRDDTIEREFKSIHKAPISQLKINPSNTLLATASSDGTVKLWNLLNHYCSHNLKGVNGVIACLDFLDGTHGDEENLLFCTGGDDCIHVFSLQSSERISKLSKHCSSVTDFKFDSGNQSMISVGRDKIAVVWDITRGENFGSVIRTIPLFESVESLVIVESRLLTQVLDRNVDHDRLLFATVGEEGSIKFWDTKTGSKILTQNQAPLSDDRNPSSPCFQLAYRPHHDQLVVVSAERDVFFYQLPHLNLVQQLQGHLDEILSTCWFADDKYLAIACNSNDLKIMDVATSRCQHLKGHSDIVVCVSALPVDPLCIISSAKDCTILVWQFDKHMDGRIIYRATGHTHAIHSLGVSPDEPTFFSGGEDTTLKRWTLPDHSTDGLGFQGDPISIISSYTIKAHEARIDAIDVSPNNQLVATGSRDKTAKIFSASKLQIIATLKGHRRGVSAVQFSPVDQVIVTAADMNLRMWNLLDFTCVKTFQGHDCAVLNFSFLSNGMQIISMGADGNMKLWDCKTNESVHTIDAHSGSTWTLSLTKDDSKVATGGQDEKLTIWKDVTEEKREEKLANLQTQVVREQDFVNYINKKKWKKALKLALKMENQPKTLNVLREILLEPNGSSELEEVIAARTLDQINFIIECCLSWNSTAKNSSLAQQVMNIIIRHYDNLQLMRLPALNSSMDSLRRLTEKSYSRCERLVQQAAFVDFFMGSLRIQ